MSLAWFKDLTEKRAAMDAQIKAEGQGHLKVAFDEFFSAHPKVDAVVWNQYTPYFNDGEACVFRVGDPVFVLTPAEGQEPINHEELHSAYDYEDLPHVSSKPSDHVYAGAEKEKTENSEDKWYTKRIESYEASKGIIDAVDAFKAAVFADAAMLEGVFGDHKFIRATRKGLEVNEYEHD